LVALPDAEERDFRRQLVRFEQEKKMPYITSIERLALKEGTANVVMRQARKRFPEFAAEDEEAIRRMSLARLEQLSDAMLDFRTIGDLRQWLARRPRSRRPSAADSKDSTD
jgi:hypothetical protein